MMHVLLVCCSFVNSESEAMTGMPKAVLINAEILKHNGYEVKILTTGSKNRRWMCRGIEIVTYGKPVSTTSTPYRIVVDTIKRESGFVKAINSINSQWLIDIIQYAGLWGTGLFRIKSIPSVMRVSGYTKLQRSIISKRETAIKILTLMDQRAVKNMDAVFCPGKKFAEVISKDTDRDVSVIETPFISENVIESERLYKKRLYNKDYIIYVGRISWDKGFPVLADAIYELFDKYPNLFLVVAGRAAVSNSPFERTILENAGKYKNRIVFLGMINHVQLFPIIRNSKAVVLPSVADNFPNTCMEAMNLGAIVIGTEGTSFEQLIKDGYNGFLAKAGDSKSLGDKVSQCLDLSEEDRKRISKKACEVVSKHTADTYFASIKEVYESVISQA